MKIKKNKSKYFSKYKIFYSFLLILTITITFYANSFYFSIDSDVNKDSAKLWLSVSRLENNIAIFCFLYFIWTSNNQHKLLWTFGLIIFGSWLACLYIILNT